jgi:cytochrome c
MVTNWLLQWAVIRTLNVIMRATLVAGIAATAMLTNPDVSLAGGDPGRGEKLYQTCKACHAIDRNGIGPMHNGVYGSKAGSVQGYHYSEALKNSDIIWNDETLDAWLTNPQAFVRGSTMFYQIGVAQDRADIIEYLKGQARADHRDAAIKR